MTGFPTTLDRNTILGPGLSLCAPFRGEIKIAIQDDSWIMEEKYDGDRVALYIDEGRVYAHSRRGRIITPKILQKQDWHDFTVVLDGELLDYRYMVFDILAFNQTQLHAVPLHARKKLLELMRPILPSVAQISPFASTEREKVAMLREAVDQGKEGVILKLTGTFYQSGRHSQWAKLKFYKTLDAVVTEIGGNGKPESASLALRINYNVPEMLHIGSIKIPMKYQREQQIVVGDVVEVRYLYITSERKLYQPVFLRVRRDKLPADCTAAQFRNHGTALPYYMTPLDTPIQDGVQLPDE